MALALSREQVVAAHGHSVVSDALKPVTVAHAAKQATVTRHGGRAEGEIHFSIPTPPNLSPASRLTKVSAKIESSDAAEIKEVSIYFGTSQAFHKDIDWPGNPGDLTQNFDPIAFVPGEGLGVTYAINLGRPTSELRVASVNMTFLE